MASTTIQFGKAHFNGSSTVWSIRRQILTLPVSRVPSEIFASPNIASVSSTITIPLRGGSTIPASGVYDNLKVVIFKGFNDDYIGSDNSRSNWMYGNNYSNTTSGQTGMNFICKESTSGMTEYGFQYGLIDNYVLTPLAYFSGSATLNKSTDGLITFTNPVFTDAGKRLENWMPSTVSNTDFKNKLCVAVYHDSEDITWTDSDGGQTDLLWAYPSLKTEQYATLTLNYGAGVIRYHNGSEWIECEVYRNNGTSWDRCEVNYHDGNSWKAIG
jgi:hypothetical protein